jgi:transposase InsO family protein
MVSFIDQHRDTYGVEPICAVLPIAPSTYFLRKAQQQDATTRSARARRDDELRAAIGLYKTEVIQRKGPWRHLEAVEFATLHWVDWFNTRRLLEPIGCVPPAEYEARYYQQLREPTTIDNDVIVGIPAPASTDDRGSWGIL